MELSTHAPVHKHTLYKRLFRIRRLGAREVLVGGGKGGGSAVGPSHTLELVGGGSRVVHRGVLCVLCISSVVLVGGVCGQMKAS